MEGKRPRRIQETGFLAQEDRFAAEKHAQQTLRRLCST
jgi:hypothetical protein